MMGSERLRLVSSEASDWATRSRKRAADVLRRLAQRLDPNVPTVTAGPGGSHVVSVGGTPLARIDPGMIRDTREVKVAPGSYTAGGRGPFKAREQSASSVAAAAGAAGHNIAAPPMSADVVRDMLVSASPDHAGTVKSRDQIVEKWCRDNGKSKDSLSVDDIMAIRALPEWKHPG